MKYIFLFILIIIILKYIYKYNENFDTTQTTQPPLYHDIKIDSVDIDTSSFLYKKQIFEPEYSEISGDDDTNSELDNYSDQRRGGCSGIYNYIKMPEMRQMPQMSKDKYINFFTTNPINLSSAAKMFMGSNVIIVNNNPQSTPSTSSTSSTVVNIFDIDHVDQVDGDISSKFDEMFSGYVSSATINFGIWESKLWWSNVSNLSKMFHNTTINITGLEKWNVSYVKNMEGMFESFKPDNKGGINVTDWNVSNVTNMTNMFKGSTVNIIGLQNWEINNIRELSMESMFESFNPTNKGVINVTDWNVSKVTNMKNMFKGSTVNITGLDKWNPLDVKNMEGMFESFKPDIKGVIDVTEWKVSNVKNMTNMFKGSTVNITGLDNWDVSNITSFEGMFESFKPDIKGVIDVTDWNVSNVTNMKNMFNNSNITIIGLQNWDVSNVTSFDDMFIGHELNTNFENDNKLDNWIYTIVNKHLQDYKDTYNKDLTKIEIEHFYKTDERIIYISNITDRTENILYDTKRYSGKIGPDICNKNIQNEQECKFVVDTIYNQEPKPNNWIIDTSIDTSNYPGNGCVINGQNYYWKLPTNDNENDNINQNYKQLCIETNPNYILEYKKDISKSPSNMLHQIQQFMKNGLITPCSTSNDNIINFLNLGTDTIFKFIKMDDDSYNTKIKIPTFLEGDTEQHYLKYNPNRIPILEYTKHHDNSNSVKFNIIKIGGEFEYVKKFNHIIPTDVQSLFTNLLGIYLISPDIDPTKFIYITNNTINISDIHETNDLTNIDKINEYYKNFFFYACI